MKVCYLFSNIDFGKTTGQSGVALNLIERVKKLGHEIYIISNNNKEKADLNIEGVKGFFIEGLSTFRTYFLNSYKILKYLKKIKPDIIHVQGHLLIPFIYFLNKLVRSNIVCLLPERIDYFNRIFRYLIVSSINNIGFCFVLSQWNKRSLIQLGVSPDKILVIHIGLKDSFLDKKQARQEYEYDIFYYGDANNERGFDILYNLAKMSPNLKFKLLIRWEKEERKSLDELQKLNNVSVDYSCPEESILKQIILKSKLVFLPYRWMGVLPPITLLETMALGKCVLTSNLLGDNELILDNNNVVLINPNSPTEDIKKKIELLLNNPEIIEKIGQEANKIIVKLFSSSEYDKIFLFYEMIAGNFYEWRMFHNIGGAFISKKENDTLLKLLQLQDNDNILDVGTGSGRFARVIVKTSKARVTGIDPDEKILAEGKKLRNIFLSAEENSRYKCVFGDGHNIPFDNNKFDKVFCFRVLKYYKDPWQGIDELIRVLKPRGILVLEIISNRSWESFVRPLQKSSKSRYINFWEKHMIPFNSEEVKKYLLNKNMTILKEAPLHKIPPLAYTKLKSKYANCLLNAIDKVLLIITPKYLFSKSIVLKCKKL